MVLIDAVGFEFSGALGASGGRFVLAAEEVLLVVTEPAPPPAAWPKPEGAERINTSAPRSKYILGFVNFIRSNRQQQAYQNFNYSKKMQPFRLSHVLGPVWGKVLRKIDPLSTRKRAR
jgi:hypothetical protein